MASGPRAVIESNQIGKCGEGKGVIDNEISIDLQTDFYGI